jgi:hypothetical protein
MAQQMLNLQMPVTSTYILNDIKASLTIEEACLYVEKYAEQAVCDRTPFRPKGGEVYIFKPSGAITMNDWRADGHSWINNGVRKLPRKEPVLTKSYFLLNTGKGVSTKNFRKEAYQLQGVVLLHYIGDETLSVSMPHGNSKKQTKIFIRTKPSVVEKLAVNLQYQEPHKVYKEAVAKVAVGQDEVITGNDINIFHINKYLLFI